MIGPKNPLECGECRVITPYLKSLRFPDGILYEIQVPIGSPLITLQASILCIPEGDRENAVAFSAVDEGCYMFYGFWVDDN